MGGCSTAQPKRTEGCSVYPMADRALEEEESPPDQVLTQVQQVRLEGKDSIVRFLCRTATGSSEREERMYSHMQQRRK
ncbi:hypothetical protein NDU88_006076 [Pleurodeles waltl]|uniref:Uncharacterized protein n=1 Tax=Pleurodeles waltl TaxID=8319 RepID=A0AAV7LN89_PLEWA|nr:hypothetical protein NDU88_006076 [Pleurodeles waltl]